MCEIVFAWRAQALSHVPSNVCGIARFILLRRHHEAALLGPIVSAFIQMAKFVAKVVTREACSYWSFPVKKLMIILEIFKWQ